MKMGAKGWLVLALAVVAPRLASAQEECPVAEIGQSCDAGSVGTCLSATCTETADGATTSRSCGACVMLPPNACADAGDSCDDGGTCDESSAGFGGGSTSGSFSFMIWYSYGVCENPVDAGGVYGDAAARGLGAHDAAVATSGGAQSADAGSQAASNSSRSSGCTVSDRVPNEGFAGLGALGLMGVVATFRRRRGKARTGRQREYCLGRTHFFACCSGQKVTPIWPWTVNAESGPVGRRSAPTSAPTKSTPRETSPTTPGSR
jgi:hypothetical protein